MSINITTEEKVLLMIATLRASIRLDWAKLALEPLGLDERKVTTRRLVESTKALKDLAKTRMRLMPKLAQPAAELPRALSLSSRPEALSH